VDPDGSGMVSNQRTCRLIRQPGPIADRLFEVEFQDAGVEAYCFTFG
jgi:Thioredoxin like C-terminal domain